jgi:glucoamylase
MYDSSSGPFQVITSAIKEFADGFIEVNAQYTPQDGSLSEQYNKDNGTPLSAKDLTWSYASAITVFMARNGTAQDSWGAKGLIVPSVCQGNSGPQVPVTFEVTANTVFGGRSSQKKTVCRSCD